MSITSRMVNAHGNFDGAREVNIAEDGVDLGAGTLGRTDLTIPDRAVAGGWVVYWPGSLRY